jgi:tetratricopeptide (TPR) repeat protein
MNDLRPGVPAFTRASYVFELRGDIDGATQALERALHVATAPADKAFVQLYLGELAFNYRAESQAALTHYEQGLRSAPQDHALQAARAKALAATGRGADAVAAYRQVVDAAPLPQYVLELAELLQSRHDPGAAQQLQVFRAALALYRANKVTVDVEATLFAADHGTPAQALDAAKAGWRTRPFVEMADAYAWALYRNHRYAQALGWSDRALAHGWNSPLALYHRGMIESRLGHRSAAVASLHRCLALNPGFDPIRAPLARAELHRLLGAA